MKVVAGPLLPLLLWTLLMQAMAQKLKLNLRKMILELAKMCHTRVPCLVIVVIALDLIVLMILIDHRDFGIMVVGEYYGGDPLVISFLLHMSLHFPLTSIFPMAPHCHHLLTAIQIILGAALIVGVVLGHLEVVHHQAGWRGAEGDILMAPHMREEELYQDPLHLIGTSLWIFWRWSKMVQDDKYFVYVQLFFFNSGPLPPHPLPPSHGPPPPDMPLLPRHGPLPPNHTPNESDPTNVSALLSKLVNAGLIGGESSESTPAVAPPPGSGPEGRALGERVTPPPMLRQTPPPLISGPRLSLTPATLKQ